MLNLFLLNGLRTSLQLDPQDTIETFRTQDLHVTPHPVESSPNASQTTMETQSAPVSPDTFQRDPLWMDVSLLNSIPHLLSSSTTDLVEDLVI